MRFPTQRPTAAEWRVIAWVTIVTCVGGGLAGAVYAKGAGLEGSRLGGTSIRLLGIGGVAFLVKVLIERWLR